MNVAALDQLLARDASVEEEPEQIRAMPVILRLEKSDSPARTPLLEAAAAATVAVCLDDRAGEGGAWQSRVSAWLGLRIRKVARRARGAQWEATQELDGVTATVEGAQARALVPDLVSEVPYEVRRLQISGTELPADAPGEPPGDVPVLWLNPNVPMTLGKAAAQVGHGSMLLAANLHARGAAEALASWQQRDGFRCAVRVPEPARWQDALDAGEGVVVRDAGFTEVIPGTVTVLAWPQVQRPQR